MSTCSAGFTVYALSLGFPILDTSCKWNPGACDLLCLELCKPQLSALKSDENHALSLPGAVKTNREADSTMPVQARFQSMSAAVKVSICVFPIFVFIYK